MMCLAAGGPWLFQTAWPVGLSRVPSPGFPT